MVMSRGLMNVVRLLSSVNRQLTIAGGASELVLIGFLFRESQRDANVSYTNARSR